MTDEPFLARWSRLKAERRRGEALRAAEPAEAPPPAPADEPSPSEPAPAPAEEKPAELPPLDSLTADSDYSVFMKAEVPEETRLAALRKLWTSDPVLAAPDPLDFQNLDFRFPSVPEVVKTAYVVGKGFLDAAEKLAETEKKEEEEGPDAPPESATREET